MQTKVLDFDWQKQNNNFIINLNNVFETGVDLTSTKGNVIKGYTQYI